MEIIFFDETAQTQFWSKKINEWKSLYKVRIWIINNLIQNNCGHFGGFLTLMLVEQLKSSSTKSPWHQLFTSYYKTSQKK